MMRRPATRPRSLLPALLGLALLATAGASAQAQSPGPLDAVRVHPLSAPSSASVWAASPHSAPDPRAVAVAARLRQPWSAHWASAPRFAVAEHPTADQADALDELRGRVGAAVELRLRHPTGTPRLIKGAVLERAAGPTGGVSEERTARAFLRSNRRLLRLDDPDRELTLERHEGDHLGRRHLRFSQSYRGLPVWPSDVIVHLDRSGNVDLMNGAFVATPRLSSLQPVLDAGAAVGLAQAAVPGGGGATVTDFRLIVYAPAAGPARLAWKASIGLSLVSHWLVVIDAETGATLLAFDQVMDASAAGSGADVFGVTRPLNVFAQGATFFLVDTSKRMFDPTSAPPSPTTTRGAIFVLDARNQPPSSNPQALPDVIQVTSTSATAGFLRDGVSAAFNFSETYDYYLARHGRNSLDGQGGSIQAIVRYGQGYANAFFNGEQQLMVFGDAQPYAGALDVVAHELTHGVTAHSANLVYQDQPGALNEAFSDIFGELVEARTLGGPDWITGSVLGGGLRNLKNPGAKEIIAGRGRPYPAKMSELIGPTDPFLDNFSGRDNGGVHINSTIISHAFYLLAEGLAGAVGLDDAGRIFYRALTVHLVASSQFVDARLACIQSAEELFGAGSTQARKTAEAFDAVEIVASTPVPSPPTPLPVPRPPVSGRDATIFLFQGQFGQIFPGRREEAFGDPPEGVPLTLQDVAPSRPSVTGDGTLAWFVNAVNDVCVVPTDRSILEVCLGFPGLVHSVAVSPDGQRFGFVFLDAFGSRDNLINLIDVAPGSPPPRTFTLVAPALDATAVDAVLFADAMAFTADGRFLLYDALNQVRLADGTRLPVWSIYAIDLGTERTLALVPPVPGLDIGFPALSHTNDSIITFDALHTATQQSTVFSGNLNTGAKVRVATASGGYAVPSYTGDDSGIVYSEAASTPTGSSLLLQPLAADRMTPSGAASVWLRDAAAGVIYRRGALPSTAVVTLSGTQFRPGQSLTVGISILNPASNPAADLYVGAILPDGRTALFFSAPGVVGGAASLLAPASFPRMQAAPPGLVLDLPAFFRFTFPPTGVAPGTYQIFAALVRQGGFLDNRIDAADLLGFGLKTFTFSQ